MKVKASGASASDEDEDGSDEGRWAIGKRPTGQSETLGPS